MSESPKYKITKVVDGKRVEPLPPKEVHLTNADFFRVAEYGLYALKQKKNDYIYASIQYNDKYPETLSKNQIDFLTDLFRGVDEHLNKHPLLEKSKHRFTKTLRLNVSKLAETYQAYQDKLKSIKLPPDLAKSSKELINFVLEFSETFHFIDNLILDINKIPNRHVDFKVRIAVNEIINEHQSKNQTTKYPKYPYVIKSLNTIKSSPRLKLSARQYRKLQNWRDIGTYWWYIQP
jgi:hypothetical protein